MPTYRKIAQLDLSRFPAPEIQGDQSLLIRVLWYLTSVLFFQGGLALLPSSIKASLLRLFGAQIGHGAVIKPRVTIKSPWFLTLGEHVWIGEMVWIDNHAQVEIGSNSCISQGAYIFTGNHNWDDPAFGFFCKPVTIGEGVWVTAHQRITPGSVIPPGVAVVPTQDPEQHG